MNGCFNCKKRYLCTESDCFDGFYEDNLYLGSNCNKYEYEGDDNMIEPIEPNEALNNSLRALDRTFDEIMSKQDKMSNEEFCSHCDRRITCEDRIASTTCPTNYEAWIETVNKCREMMGNKYIEDHASHQSMRDGEEIRAFFDELDKEGNKDE